MIIQNVSQDALTDISFTVPRGELAQTLGLIKKVAETINAREVEVKDDIAKVSLVGVGMRSHSGIAARMFLALSREGINIMMISTSEIKVSCVVEEKYLELALRALHNEFELDKAPSFSK